MTRAATWPARASPAALGPLLWTFDGALAACVADVEQTLRRTIVQLGDVSGIAVAIDVSLPTLAARVRAGDAIQPCWQRFVEQLARYGLPSPPRIRHRPEAGPLFTLVVLYRS
jgi:hypothetical protein